MVSYAILRTSGLEQGAALGLSFLVCRRGWGILGICKEESQEEDWACRAWARCVDRVRG